MKKQKIVVAGHLCRDLHPVLKKFQIKALITPGKVLEIGEIELGIGVSASNTGIILFKLRVDTNLMTCVGDNIVSQMILESIRCHDPKLIQNIIWVNKQSGSYTIVSY